MQISTGASAFMAIRTLLDHGVQQDHIVFVTFLVAQTGGIHVIKRAFPQVKIICGAIDPGLRETWIELYHSEGEGQHGTVRKVWVVEPGMGHIGKSFESSPFLALIGYQVIGIICDYNNIYPMFGFLCGRSSWGSMLCRLVRDVSKLQ